MPEFWHKSHSKYVKNLWKSFKIDRKSFQNQAKTTPNPDKSVIGAFSAPNHAQVGSRARPAVWSNRLLEPFCPKMVFQGSIFGPLENPKSPPKRTFEDRQALGPSKNGLGEGVQKKRENLTKNRYENGRFLMAWKHVWRYTLSLI